MCNSSVMLDLLNSSFWVSPIKYYLTKRDLATNRVSFVSSKRRAESFQRNLDPEHPEQAAHSRPPTPQLPLALCGGPPRLATSLCAHAHTRHTPSPHILEVLAYCAPECGGNLLQPKADGHVRGPALSLLFPTIWHSHTWVSHLHSTPAKCLALLFGWLLNQPSPPRERETVFFLSLFHLHILTIIFSIQQSRKFI